MNLSRTGEVGEFLDNNQFQEGSQDKCGPETVATVFHSAAPGKENPFTSHNIEHMAEADYTHFIGRNVLPDIAGTDNETLYHMLRSHSLPFEILPHDWSVVCAKLAEGKPVIIGGVRESTVFDVGLGRCPYGWAYTDQLFHIILATGLGSQANTLKFRDTANVRVAGPREYRTDHMTFTTATAIHPAWLGNGGDEMLQITDPFAKQYFTETATTPVHRWHCETTHQDVIGGILAFYRKIGGAPRLPTSGEKRHASPNDDVVYQEFEAGVIVYDPNHKLPHPAGFTETFLLTLKSDEVKGIVCG